MKIQCPKCHWSPTPESEWACDHCGYIWNIFDTAAKCPQCGYQHENVYCIEWEGGCGEYHPYYNWVTGMDSALEELNIKRGHGDR